MAEAEVTMDAHDEVVVVFGGSSGIGEAVARAMVARGSQVVIAGRDPGRLAAAAGRLGGAVRTAAVDAGDRDAVDAFFAGLAFDVDHLVLSFSTGRAGGPFRDLPMVDLAAAVCGKLLAYLSVMQASLPRLRADGSVTLIGASGHRGAGCGQRRAARGRAPAGCGAGPAAGQCRGTRGDRDALVGRDARARPRRRVRQRGRRPGRADRHAG